MTLISLKLLENVNNFLFKAFFNIFCALFSLWGNFPFLINSKELELMSWIWTFMFFEAQIRANANPTCPAPPIIVIFLTFWLLLINIYPYIINKCYKITELLLLNHLSH